MGRHRRSAPASPEAAGAADRTGTPAAAHPASAGRHRGRRSAPDRRAAPVRTGLLGASAAVAMGAVAVASGLLPGGSQYDWSGNGGAGERVRAGSLPTAPTRDAASVTPSDRGTGQASRGETRPGIPEREHPTPAATPSATPASRQSSEPADTGSGTGADTGTGTGTGADRDRTERPGRTTPSSAAPQKRTPSATAAPDATPATAEAQVLALVNQERAKVGCSPLTADPQLATLARDFSTDMARRDFFDHTDPDGHSPWDRAKAAGIDGLGGENIARGQADARAVMDTWMHSSGHRANILNCEYKTLGVGAHFGPGGPWWTQDFGF
ncbi:CAP domain-containing protein [Streptomyces rimosus]|uniref:CAP domain-containing protein n=1 Tax=Streptomyces rimosus TaxID=1927 RepID=UPI0004C56574|nr:CAP domain-containing protein [Streptomyces rimosus]